MAKAKYDKKAYEFYEKQEPVAEKKKEAAKGAKMMKAKKAKKK